MTRFSTPLAKDRATTVPRGKFGLTESIENTESSSVNELSMSNEFFKSRL